MRDFYGRQKNHFQDLALLLVYSTQRLNNAAIFLMYSFHLLNYLFLIAAKLLALNLFRLFASDNKSR